MATVFRHFENWKNSCAIDSFLELAQFSFYHELSNISKGSFLTHIYNACRSREQDVELPLREIREPAWNWLQANASTFAGCTNGASFEQILDFIATTKDEQDLFTTVSNWHYVCSLCSTEKIERKDNLPLYISSDVLADCDYDLEQTVNALLYHPEGRTKTCDGCKDKSRQLCFTDVELSNYLFIRLPTLVANQAEPNVVDGIRVKEQMWIGGGDLYRLCGAVSGRNDHFSVSIGIDGGFCHIDDVSLNVRMANSFAELAGQGHGSTVYETNSEDGYFLLVFKSIDGKQQTGASLEVDQADTHSHTPPVKTEKRNILCSPTQGPGKRRKMSLSEETLEKDAIPTVGPLSPIIVMTDPQYSSTPLSERVDTPTTGSSYTCNVQNRFEVLSDEVPAFVDQCEDNTECHIQVLRTPEKKARRNPFGNAMGAPLSPCRGVSVPVKSTPQTPAFIPVSPASSCPSPPAKTLPSYPGSTVHDPRHTSVTDDQTLVSDEPDILDPEIKYFDGKPFVRLAYALSALSLKSTRMCLAKLKSKHEQLKLNIGMEFYPEHAPEYMSLEAFIYHIFKATSTHSVRKIQAHFFHVLDSRFQTDVQSLAGFDLLSGLDENNGVFMKLEDCYSLCGIQGVNKRIRQFQRAEKCLQLCHKAQFLSRSQLEFGKCTHVNANTVIGYMFIRVGNKRYSEISDTMQNAMNLVIELLLEWVTELPFIFPPDTDIDVRALDDITNSSEGSLFRQRQSVPPQQPSATTPRSRTSRISSGVSTTTQSNKTMARRAKKQQDGLARMTHEIHHGGKESFKTGLHYSLQHSLNSKSANDDNGDWSGILTCEDLIEVLGQVESKGDTSFIDQYVQERAATLNHINARDIISLVDNCNSNNLVDNVRKLLPGYLASRSDTKKKLKDLEDEFEVILRPRETSTGYRIDPDRLLHCLRHLYYFIPHDKQLWKIWGDARVTGGKKCCNITLSPLNNEIALHNLKFHSPKDIWPIALFYGADGRWNLEGNLGGEAGQPGWLNDWVCSEQQSERSMFFLTGDSMFLDAIHGKHGELAPNSKTGFNIYSTDPIEEKHKTGENTGLRSELPKSINRDVPNSLLPSIPLSRTVFCLDHATTRTVEKLVQLRVKSIVSASFASTQTSHCKQEIERRLSQFKKNMMDRMVHKAERLSINSDGSLAERLTLNKRDAHALLLEPTPEHGVTKPLLEGVASTAVMFEIDSHTQKLLQWPSRVSEYVLETAMWTSLSQAIFSLRKSDPKPQIKPGCQLGSLNADDYAWGLGVDEVNKLVVDLDVFHKLFVIRYGGNSLTPYMMKLIDFTPVILHSLPVTSLMRFATEGGERLHHDDNCYFFQHTQRGGSYRTYDPIYATLLHRYRVLQKRLIDYSQDECPEKAAAGRDFLDWVEQEVMSANSSLDTPPVCTPQSSAYNFILVGRVPTSIMKASSCSSKKEFCNLLQQNKSRVVDVIPSQLPKIYESVKFVVLAQQTLCDSNKPPEALQIACRRKWPIVSYSFCPEYLKSPLTLFDEFTLDLTSLKRHCRFDDTEEVKGCKDHFFKRRGPIHPVTLHKRQNKTPRQPSNKKTLKRPGSGYARFVEQELKHAKVGQDGMCWADLNREVAERWKKLHRDEKEKFNRMAKVAFEQSKENDPQGL